MTDPTFLPALIYGGWALTLFGYGFWLLDRVDNPQRRRLLLAALVAVCLAIASPAFASQPVGDPCHSCESASGLLWWLIGCWSCP